MIQEITIENYKSIQSLSIELGRVTVFIGENGCGKSNILEAIALGSAAAADKLDNEFLASRGIRVTDPKLMRSAFDLANLDKEIKIFFKLQDYTVNTKTVLEYDLNHDNAFYSTWNNQSGSFRSRYSKNIIERTEEWLEKRNEVNSLQIDLFDFIDENNIIAKNFQNIDIDSIVLNDLKNKNIKIKNMFLEIEESTEKMDQYKKEAEFETTLITNFLIFCIELTELKEFSREGQIEPLGIKGQGLFKYLRYLSQPQFKEKLDEIKEKLELIDWFEDFDIPDNLYPGERTLKLKDRYLDPDLEYFDQKSANEGFLFLLFYFCLFIGEKTPKFFAIDNIDSSLNPRLCRRLIQELVELAKKYDKQVILTTHNPAILDGLDLDDQEQKLYVIKRKRSGQTRAIQIFTPKPLPDQEPVPLSEAFLRGYIGGLPKNF
jgi:AAA15 family ATPase/GTPase